MAKNKMNKNKKITLVATSIGLSAIIASVTPSIVVLANQQAINEKILNNQETNNVSNGYNNQNVMYKFNNKLYESYDAIANEILSNNNIINQSLYYGDLNNAIFDQQFKRININEMRNYDPTRILPAYIDSLGNYTFDFETAKKSYANKGLVRYYFVNNMGKLFETENEAIESNRENLKVDEIAFYKITDYDNNLNPQIKYINPLNVDDINTFKQIAKNNILNILNNDNYHLSKDFKIGLFSNSKRNQKSNNENVYDPILTNFIYNDLIGQFQKIMSNNNSSNTNNEFIANHQNLITNITNDIDNIKNWLLKNLKVNFYVSLIGNRANSYSWSISDSSFNKNNIFDSNFVFTNTTTLKNKLIQNGYSTPFMYIYNPSKENKYICNNKLCFYQIPLNYLSVIDKFLFYSNFSNNTNTNTDNENNNFNWKYKKCGDQGAWWADDAEEAYIGIEFPNIQNNQALKNYFFLDGYNNTGWLDGKLRDDFSLFYESRSDVNEKVGVEFKIDFYEDINPNNKILNKNKYFSIPNDSTFFNYIKNVIKNIFILFLVLDFEKNENLKYFYVNESFDNIIAWLDEYLNSVDTNNINEWFTTKLSNFFNSNSFFEPCESNSKSVINTDNKGKYFIEKLNNFDGDFVNSFLKSFFYDLNVNSSISNEVNFSFQKMTDFLNDKILKSINNSDLKVCITYKDYPVFQINNLNFNINQMSNPNSKDVLKNAIKTIISNLDPLKYNDMQNISNYFSNQICNKSQSKKKIYYDLSNKDTLIKFNINQNVFFDDKVINMLDFPSNYYEPELPFNYPNDVIYPFENFSNQGYYNALFAYNRNLKEYLRFNNNAPIQNLITKQNLLDNVLVLKNNNVLGEAYLENTAYAKYIGLSKSFNLSANDSSITLQFSENNLLNEKEQRNNIKPSKAVVVYNVLGEPMNPGLILDDNIIESSSDALYDSEKNVLDNILRTIIIEKSKDYFYYLNDDGTKTLIKNETHSIFSLYWENRIYFFATYNDAYNYLVENIKTKTIKMEIN